MLGEAEDLVEKMKKMEVRMKYKAVTCYNSFFRILILKMIGS